MPGQGCALEAKREFVAGRRDRVPEGAIARGRSDSFACTPAAADKKIDKRKDRAPEGRIVAFRTNRPDIDVEMHGQGRGGEPGNRQFKPARPRTGAARQGPRVLGLVASLVACNAWVVINALLHQESMVRIRSSPPLIELDSLPAIRVNTMTGPAHGPGPPRPPPPLPGRDHPGSPPPPPPPPLPGRDHPSSPPPPPRAPAGRRLPAACRPPCAGRRQRQSARTAAATAG